MGRVVFEKIVFKSGNTSRPKLTAGHIRRRIITCEFEREWTNHRSGDVIIGEGHPIDLAVRSRGQAIRIVDSDRLAVGGVLAAEVAVKLRLGRNPRLKLEWCHLL